MRGLSFPSSPNRRRAVAFVLTLIIEAIFLLAFLVPFRTFQRKTEPALTTIALQPAEKAAASRKATTAKAKAARSAPEKPPPPRPVDPTALTPPYVKVTREDFAAGDISKLPSHQGEGETGTQSAGSGYGPGEGPNGAPLYNAEWYREPTPGELALYLKNGVSQNSSAMIMCQTAPDYKVENCRGLSENPPGSGLASALRQASWQFKVRPPRVGGKALIGAWVRILFTWTEK
ncbi:MAG: hypothetical protein ABI898_07195 [Sphingomonadales bacterium]